MTIDALEISITEESHQSVMVDEYRFDFIYNALIDRWFVTVYENESLVFGSIKIVPNKNLFDFMNIGELIVFYAGEITRNALFYAKLIYIPKVEDEV